MLQEVFPTTSDRPLILVKVHGNADVPTITTITPGLEELKVLVNGHSIQNIVDINTLEMLMVAPVMTMSVK